MEETNHTTPARDAIAILDALSGAQMRALTLDELRKFSDLCYHWGGLTDGEFSSRLKASREEESE